jgi:micrococcal nuclease
MSYRLGGNMKIRKMLLAFSRNKHILAILLIISALTVLLSGFSVSAQSCSSSEIAGTEINSTTTTEKIAQVTEETEETLSIAGISQTTDTEPAQDKFFFICRVVEVIDGDTVKIDTGEKVRYIGIDTPEKGELFCEECTKKNEELVLGKEVGLERDVSITDKYGRLLAYVWVGDLMVNSEMVKTGYAHAYTYPPDVKYSDLFVELEREARENEYGLWAEPETTASTEQTTTTIAATITTIATTTTTTVAATTTTIAAITTTTQPQSEPQPQGQYVGSIKSDVFHYPSCFYVDRIKPENIIWFSSREDAFAHGYRPCKKCCP